MPVLKVNTTQTYNKARKQLKISDKQHEDIEKWALSFSFTITSRSDMVFISPRRKVSIWEVRIPDPSKNKGASGGYRMLCFFVEEESTMFLDYINERKAFNNSKAKQEYQAHLRALKGELAKNYDPR
jgi:hypothetical protein